MYSVLFQNRKVMEYYEDYRPVFMPLIKRGELGLCQWMEAGTTVDTMIPGIYDMISDKEEWRAVIMCTNEANDRNEFPFRPENPYDFLENSDPEPTTKESRIPLIRLTQMLGGVPSPAICFEPQIVREKNKAERMIYTPSVREEDQEIYHELLKKYEFYGKRPSEIILICPRERKQKEDENARAVWTRNKETEASDFWKRNGYPARCRFLVFDITREGDVKKTEELFNLWNAVMLLASNEINPSTIQAYRLYRIETEFDRKKLEQAFQKTAGRTLRARRFLEHSIRRELEKSLSEDVILPEFELEAPVILKLPDRRQIYSEEGRFGMTAKTDHADREILRDMKEKAENALDQIGTCTARALDQTAERVRQCASYTEPEVYPLNRYQLEDMTGKLENEYRQIFELRNELPETKGKSRRELEELVAGIRGELKGRTTHGQAAAALAAGVSVFALSLVPGLFYGTGAGSRTFLFAFAAAGAALFAGAEAACLWAGKTKLQDRVSDLERYMNRTVTAVSEDGQQFSRYMSRIATYLHGSSFLTVMKQKQESGKGEISERKRHIEALGTFYENIKEWCRAYHMKMYFDSTLGNEEMMIDTDLSPEMNPMYTFPAEEGCLAEVNNTGDMIETPFGFIRKLKIIREELYDDAK